MSYYPVKPPNPYGPQSPASPVPSYRSSSQSSGYTSSVTSVSASLPPTPTWANPHATGRDHQSPPSPSSNSHGTHTGNEIQVKEPSSPVSPYSELRARAMSARAYPEGFSPNDEEPESPRNRVLSASFAEKHASKRALKLLDKTVAEDVLVAGATAFKTSIDRSRERSAHSRALRLLNETSQAVKEPEREDERVERPAGASLGLGATVVAGTSAMRHYDDRAPALGLSRGKEHLATSSRPKRPLTAEDVRDPETVAGMKRHEDIEREKKARQRALMMMNFGCFA